jgi:O-antigen/teichoic acid export membrane protein
VLCRWILTLNLPIFVSLLIVGDQLLALVGGREMQALPEGEIAAGLKVLFALCLGMMIQGTFAIAEPLLAMAGRPYLNFGNNLFWLLANFLLNVWLIDSYGIVGAALGALAATALVSLLRMAQIYRIYRIQPFDSSQLKPVLAALAAGAAAWLVRGLLTHMVWTIAAALVVFAAVYLAVLWALGVEREDRILMERARASAARLCSGRLARQADN